jgi:predicted CoA-substrate-specific enzyme activase
MIYAGIDAGSRATKIVLWDATRQVLLDADVVDQGIRQEQIAMVLLDSMLGRHGYSREDVAGCVATGYARKMIRFATRAVTEITCHARGVRHLHPEVRLIIEIGGQDSKVIYLDDMGHIRDFAMNDRCAAGTGRFLEMVAVRMETPLEELAKLNPHVDGSVKISSMCVVFAETEIIGLLAEGVAPSAILSGIQQAIAARIVALLGSQPHVGLACFTGGVARIAGMQQALSHALGQPVTVCDPPQMTGAIGAALLAAEN